MTNRDKMILKLLNHFRVLSRDQLGTLICPTVSKPHATVNRIMKRLSRDGWVTPIPMPKDQAYLYMPNPTVIHPHSSKIQHFLGLVDIYINLEQPDIYEVEPEVSKEYRPDAYTILHEPVIIEYQRSRISNKKMQEKVNLFVKAHKANGHNAKTLWIHTPTTYDVEVPKGYTVIQKEALTD